MKILVATDGSKTALRAVKYAANLVGQLSSRSKSITLISVHDDVGLRHAKAFVGQDAVADYLRELSEKELKPARKLLDSAGVKHDLDDGAQAREFCPLIPNAVPSGLPILHFEGCHRDDD
jgi:hypothetical protein